LFYIRKRYSQLQARLGAAFVGHGLPPDGYTVTKPKNPAQRWQHADRCSR
jgi:hypothetical protein